MDLLLAIENSFLGVYIREDAWGFPIALSAHAVGMAMVVGVVLMLNFRVQGMAKEIPVLAYGQLFGVAWAGFIINLLSGAALYSSHATEYTFQFVFLFKLSLILVGGFLMKLLLDGYRAGWPEGKVKAVSALCLASWIGAIITGRLMAYF